LILCGFKDGFHISDCAASGRLKTSEKLIWKDVEEIGLGLVKIILCH
jgi:hypothetical protein